VKGINTSDTHSACSSFVLSRNRYLKVEMNHHHMFFWLIRIVDEEDGEQGRVGARGRGTKGKGRRKSKRKRKIGSLGTLLGIDSPM